MVAALVPIYFGRVGSFVIETRNQTTTDAEERVERQAREFELLKPYLVERWQAGGRTRERPAAAVPGPDPGREPAHRRGAVRIGASLMEPRTGELTALGIVEVPEGMPLSEGATRARQARRLLQKVLDYVPEGTVIHPLVRIGRHAAAGIVEAAAEQEADLMIFGWGGKSGPNRDAHAPVISPTIDEVVRESPCDIAVVKQRGARDIRRILVPVRGGPHAELALRFADALAHRYDATVSRDARRARRASPRPCAPRRSTRSPRSPASTSPRARSRSCARRRTSGRRSCARRSAPTSS